MTLSLSDLIQDEAGIFRRIAECRVPNGISDVAIQYAMSEDISRLISTFPEQMNDIAPRVLTGVGTSLNKGSATTKALAEALERYCAYMYRQEELVWSTAKKLGKYAITLDTLPRCSDKEESMPDFPLSFPGEETAMSWVSSFIAPEGSVRYVPAMMVYLSLRNLERRPPFVPISTGCAIHHNFETAACSGILEVIERDALSIMWIQQLPVPEIIMDRIPPRLDTLWKLIASLPGGLSFRYFDASTDLGVPVVIAVLLSEYNQDVATVLGCASSFDLAEAIEKASFECMANKSYLISKPEGPGTSRQCTHLHHGARMMAHRHRRELFAFLLNSRTPGRLFSRYPHIVADVDQQLQRLLSLLQSMKVDVYAVDITADEARRCGLRATRIIIPQLQPFSFDFRARYLGHKRLYDAPQAMGYSVRSEEDLNPWPVPFA